MPSTENKAIAIEGAISKPENNCFNKKIRDEKPCPRRFLPRLDHETGITYTQKF